MSTTHDPKTPDRNDGEPGQTVSFADERLVLVDEADRQIGEATKIDCHIGDGKLHRAFKGLLDLG